MLRAVAAPARSQRVPPRFLRVEQHDAWRRAMAALDGWGGALVVEPPGSGKTWIALGVAAVERRRAVAIVPAIVQPQWAHAAQRAGIPIDIWSHERASRGAAPCHDPTLVIIDEAHRFRDPGARRVRTIAPWLVGRRTLLLSATPIVNRIADLITLLRLALPDDALSLDGVLCLDELDGRAVPPIALRRVVIRTRSGVSGPAQRRLVTLQPGPAENRRGRAAVAAIHSLQLSTCVPIRKLLASVLLDAAASSDAALRAALGRYRALLLQARDAGGASRAMLRRFAGEALDQLVLWPVLLSSPVPGDLPLADIPRVELLLRAPASDEEWIDALSRRVDDTRPTICFTRHRATAQRIRIALGESTAWITGTDAGIGSHRIARDAILAAFGSDRVAWRVRREAPRVLVATDVVAEGLDLHSAGRVVHIDLPWTATRIEQREGRLLRIGQRHSDVEVVVRLPAKAIERALGPHARVVRKRRLADVWLDALAESDRGADCDTAFPVLRLLGDSQGDADLVVVRLQRGHRHGVVALVRRGDELWRPDDELAVALTNRAAGARSCPIDPDTLSTTLADATRTALATLRTRPATSPALVARIHRLARRAATNRDGASLARLDRLLRFAGASPTLGARLTMARLLDVTDREFAGTLVPDGLVAEPVYATVSVALLFRSGERPLR